MRNKADKEQVLHILMGLPGSGKTTYANFLKYGKSSNQIDFANTNMLDISQPFDKFSKNNAYVFDLDSIYKKLIKQNKKINNRVMGRVLNDIYEETYSIPRSEITVLDGLILNHDDCKMFIDIFLFDLIGSHFKTLNKIIIDYWTPNIDICIWNNSGLRKKDAKHSIKNLKISKPDIKKLTDEYGGELEIQLLEHQIVKKPDFRILADSLDKNNWQVFGKYIYSDSWCCGGTGTRCDGSIYFVDPEDKPDFIEFEVLIENLFSDISFKAFKELYSYAVNTETFKNSDYYLNVDESRYVCDLEKLYKKAKEIKII